MEHVVGNVFEVSSQRLSHQVSKLWIVILLRYQSMKSVSFTRLNISVNWTNWLPFQLRNWFKASAGALSVCALDDLAIWNGWMVPSCSGGYHSHICSTHPEGAGFRWVDKSPCLFIVATLWTLYISIVFSLRRLLCLYSLQQYLAEEWRRGLFCRSILNVTRRAIGRWW